MRLVARTVPSRVACVAAIVVALISSASARADNLKCGPGTVKVKNVCLPDYTFICGAGTQLVNGQCLPAPKQPVCGDGVVDVDALEVCDDGNTITETQCPYGTPTCTACSADCSEVLSLTGPFCGDGQTDLGHEECDDGNTCTETCPYGTPTCTICSATCTLVSATGSFCGDGITNSPEEVCDDGNPTCGTCSADCRTSLPGGDCLSDERCSTDADCVSGLCDAVVTGTCLPQP